MMSLLVLSATALRQLLDFRTSLTESQFNEPYSGNNKLHLLQLPRVFLMKVEDGVEYVLYIFEAKIRLERRNDSRCSTLYPSLSHRISDFLNNEHTTFE